ncbi:hypothetical protein [Cellulomonas aerilata]|uniref:DUF2637 domain-containing protein n=1 Tax=Cellulomonas aerilata TaxID=515326 RepID=A0A512DFS1_9CELL|nr:hypothetical protein [Cellulomonas aerilata]GEO35317.1 hypothetical protein CAE01nite_30420 [Cellulomonas aerilata]
METDTVASGRRQGHPPRRLIGAVVVLVALDLAGGLTAIADGINRGMGAWGPRARLAAPLPMILLQVVTAAVAVRAPRRPARAAAAVLALACLVSAVSGFFDGGLGAPGLSRRHVALQVVLVGWTGLTGVLTAAHVRRLGRAGEH